MTNQRALLRHRDFGWFVKWGHFSMADLHVISAQRITLRVFWLSG
jgi:hypothetical protein